MNANDQKCLEQLHKSLSLVSQAKVDGQNNKPNLHIILAWFHFPMSSFQTSQTNSFTHLAYSALYIDITYFHVFFNYLHISQLPCTHKHLTFTDEIFIIYYLVQVPTHLPLRIDMTHLHCWRTFTFSCSRTFANAHGIYIHLYTLHIYLYICMKHWQTCKQIDICTLTSHPHMHLCMHTYITHCTLTMHICN